MGNKASQKLSGALEDLVPADKSLLDESLRQYTPALAQKPSRGALESLRVLSWNLPCNTGDNKTGSKEWRRNLFKFRCPFAASLPQYYEADVFCLQEPHEKQTQMVLKEIGPGWKCFSKGREKDGSSEAQPIFYRTDKVEAVDTGCFWLSGEFV